MTARTADVPGWLTKLVRDKHRMRGHHRGKPKTIQARPGHESITTTIDTYGHLMPVGTELASQIIDTALRGEESTRARHEVDPRRQKRRRVRRLRPGASLAEVRHGVIAGAHWLLLLQLARMMGGVTQNLTATLDPADAGVRAAASRLATSIDDSSEVGRVVRSLPNEVALGERVVVLRIDDEVSRAAAAEMLGVTRKFVDRLLADEVLACRRLPGSRHRRIRVRDVFAVGVERDARRAGHEALRTAIEDAGLLDQACSTKPDRGPDRQGFIDTSELFPFAIMEQHRLAAGDSVTDWPASRLGQAP